MIPGLTKEEGRLPLSSDEINVVLAESEGVREEYERRLGDLADAMNQLVGGTTAILEDENWWLGSLLPLKERGDELSEEPV